MKFTQVRYFSHASIIFICCCISIAFAASAAATPFSFPDWIALSPNNSPPARSYLAMTYDPVSGKTIAFGGFDGTGYLNDTWSFDGTTWTHIATQSAPPARANAQMTYDSVAQKVVLFGGFDGTITWAIHGFGMGRRYSGRRPRQPITLLLLPVRCYFPILMAGPMFLADTTATSISLPCGNGTAPIGRS